MKGFLIFVFALVWLGVASPVHGATFQIAYSVNGLQLDANGIVFMSAPARSAVGFSIDDGQTLTLSTFQPYTYTNISNYGYQSYNTSSTRRITINGVERSAVSSMSGSLQPGVFNLGASQSVMTWQMDFGGDRKTLSMRVLATSGSGTHSGNIPASATLTEVADDPVAMILGFGPIVTFGEEWSLDGSASYDVDSTGSIVSWEWDLDYDGVNFAADATGALLQVTSGFMQSSYQDGESYAVALRVTDNSGASHLHTTSFVYAVPEPEMGGLVLLGLAGLLMRRRGVCAGRD